MRPVVIVFQRYLVERQGQSTGSFAVKIYSYSCWNTTSQYAYELNSEPTKG